MREILLFTDAGVFVREVDEHDLYNMFPRKKYTERPATKEDIERLMVDYE